MTRCVITPTLNTYQKLNSLKQSVTTKRPILQLKQQNQKGAITFAAHRHNVTVILNNSTLIFAVLVVRCRRCRRYRLF